MFRLLSFLLLPVAAIFCFTYDVVLQKEEIFDKCKNDPDNSLDKYVNTEHVKFAYITDELISINGEVIFEADLESTDRIALLLEVLKFERGMWVPTAFTIKRDDLCKTAYSRTELWFDFVKSAYSLRNATIKMRLNWMPDPYLEGEYKSVSKLSIKNKNGEEKFKVCFEMPFRLYRV